MNEWEQNQAPTTPPAQDPEPGTAGHGVPPTNLRITPRNDSTREQAEPSSTSTSRHGGNQTPGPFSSWSGGSDISGDRVFPIRSVVSVDPTTSRMPGEDYFPSIASVEARGNPAQPSGTISTDPIRSETGPMSPTSNIPIDPVRYGRRKSGPMSSIQADAARHGSNAPLQLDMASSDKASEAESGPLGAGQVPGAASASDASGRESVGDVPHVTTRFTHLETEDGHSIITGRDGVLQRCEDEPIHAPGATQGFGVLVAVREEDDGRFLARYVSENSEKVLGYSPRQIFRLKNFLDILTEEQQDNLLDHIDFIRDEDADPAVNGPEVFSLSVRPPKKKTTKLWCAIHINPAHPDLIICEFEMDDDQEHPLRPPEERTPDAPEDTLHANPTLEEIEDSTEVLSKPLRILRSARKRRGEQGAMQVFDIMSQVQEQLASATSLEAFLKILVGIVKELTGFHRVMIYQFDSSFNGKVVTELVDPTKTMDLYKGLHFPASDIPRQARDLYKLNKVRLLYDRDLDTARIVCRSKEDLETPLDMSHSYLRAMSPIHLKYLANMAVRSSMSISINAFNELWGLVACHSYGNHGMRVSFPIRKMCRLVGDTASRNIERLSYASRLQARKLINTAPTDKNPSGYIIASSDDLLRLFDADFGLVSIKGETKIMGSMEQSHEALAMLEYLRMRRLTSVVAVQDIKQDFPDLRYPPGFQVIAGLLYVPLSVGGNDFIVFFRRGQVKEVKWAGNPYEKFVRQGTAGYLEPRTSFKTWHETVIGKCREWNEEQVETAAVLCLVYGKFIEVWRQKEAAIQNSKLTRLLLANSAHEVRTPLNAIINYLEIALEGSLDQETRENLAKSHSASKSLIYVINDLLDLTKTEEGQNLVKDELFELPTCINEATDPFQGDARRKGIQYQAILHPGLPRFVHGDPRKVRQALSNVTANAVKHTSSGGTVTVEVLVSEVHDQQATVDFIVQDTGVGMTSQQLDTLFQDLEQVNTEDSEHESITEQSDENSRDVPTLGLGLAVVARIVRTMGGQMRLKSEVGQGSRFVLQLPFQLPADSPAAAEKGGKDDSLRSQGSNAVSSVAAELTAAPEGEVLLVDSLSARNVSLEKKRIEEAGMADGRRSVGSFDSGGSHKSDADRLIDAIRTPFSLEEKEPASYFSARPNSKGGSRPTSGGGEATKDMVFGSPKARKSGPPSLVQTQEEQPGTVEVQDTKTPIRAVKIPDEYEDMPSRPQLGEQSGVLFELPSRPSNNSGPATESVTSGGTDEDSPLQVLIAEDDPINMKILRKRLEKAGHKVFHAVNGEDCAAVYREKSPTFDVVLMDMQMPIVDGLTSTKMIRALEKSSDHAGHSHLAASNGHVPIFAVSASLVEKERSTYIDAGFDGWILKPIDFKRLHTLLMGIHDEETRCSCLYVSGEWERGGWFGMRSDVARGGREETNDEVTPNAADENKQMMDRHQSDPDVTMETGVEGEGQLETENKTGAA